MKPSEARPVDGRGKHFDVPERGFAGRFVAVEKANAVELRGPSVALADKLADQFSRRKCLAAHDVDEGKGDMTVVGAIDQFGADQLVGAEEIEVEIVGFARELLQPPLRQ